MVTILFVPFLLAVVLIGISINGLLLKFSCWVFNRWFAGPAPVPEAIADEPAPIATAMTADEYAASEAEQQANPFSSPRRAAKLPPAARGGAQVVAPTISVSLGLGFLLTGIQVAAPTAILIFIASVAPSGAEQVAWGRALAIAIGLPVTFACTTSLVWTLLSNSSFRRGLAVTVIYYATLIAFVSPWIIAAFFFAFSVSQ